MSDIPSQITGNMIVCSTVLANNKESSKALHYSSSVREIHCWPMDCPLEGPVMWKGFSCHDVGMLGKFVLHCYPTLCAVLLDAFSEWNQFWAAQGPVLLMRHDAVARILANGGAAFFESCTAIGWKACEPLPHRGTWPVPWMKKRSCRNSLVL